MTIAATIAAIPPPDIRRAGGAPTTRAGSTMAPTTTVSAIMSCSDWRFFVKATIR